MFTTELALVQHSLLSSFNNIFKHMQTIKLHILSERQSRFLRMHTNKRRRNDDETTSATGGIGLVSKANQGDSFILLKGFLNTSASLHEQIIGPSQFKVLRRAVIFKERR